MKAAFLFGLLAVGCQTSRVLARDYVTTNLTALGFSSFTGDINNLGQVAGEQTTDNFFYLAAIYSNGAVAQLPDLAIFTSHVSYAHSINDHGHVMGTLVEQGGTFPRRNLFFDGQSAQFTENLRPAVQYSQSLGLNNHDEIVYLREGFPQPSEDDFLIRVTKLVEEPISNSPNPSLPQYYSGARQLNMHNDSGDFAFTIEENIEPYPPRHYYFDHTTEALSILELSTSLDARIFGLNNEGILFGYDGANLATWFTDGSLRSVIETPSDVWVGDAVRNVNGDIMSRTLDKFMLYQEATNAWKEVTLTDVEPGYEIYDLYDFNDRGEFTALITYGNPSFPSEFRFLVASPVPEPHSLALLSFGVLGTFVGVHIRRRRVRPAH